MHAELLAEHGGAEGLRDQGGLDSAMSRPRQKYHDESPDLFALAAADIFLRLNGWRLIAPEVESVSVIRQMASSKLDEATLSEWVRKNASEA